MQENTNLLAKREETNTAMRGAKGMIKAMICGHEL